MIEVFSSVGSLWGAAGVSWAMFKFFKGRRLFWNRWRGANAALWKRYRRTMLDFNRSLTLIVDADSLMASVATRLDELFGTDRIIILHARADGGAYTVSFSTGYDREQVSRIRISQQDRLAKWLLTNGCELPVRAGSSVMSYLSAAEREMLADFDVRLCAPLLALNRLSGIMLLSSTRGDFDLSEDDMNLIQVLLAQASMAFENAYLYETQRDRLRRLYRAESLASAGQFAASVAHEIRNPLTAIRSTVQYLLGDYDAQNPKHPLIDGVIAEVDRIDRIVDGLLSLTRKAEFKPENVLLGQLIHQSLILTSQQAKNSAVEVEAQLPSPDYCVLADPARLTQLFLNLIMNAFQAMPDGGKLTILFDAKIEMFGLTGEKSWVFVSISDTGCGIAPENLDKIFDPFFTTKPGGTGLGLATCYAIARQHGGELEISSRLNEGTVATLRLPLASTDTAQGGLVARQP